MPTNILEEKARKWCESKAPGSGSSVVTIEDFMKRPLLKAAINEGLERANLKAIANPHRVQKCALLPLDLSIQGGELGPTLKLKRHFIATKYQDIIERMYAE